MMPNMMPWRGWYGKCGWNASLIADVEYSFVIRCAISSARVGSTPGIVSTVGGSLVNQPPCWRTVKNGVE